MTLLYCSVVLGIGADIDDEEVFVYYDIAPQKADTIVIELRRHSPIRKNNAVFYGNTEVEFRPHFRWKKIGKLCHVEDFKVVVNTEYTMPRLAENISFDESIKVKFDKFYNALLIHEKGHREIGIRAADDIHQLLKNVKPVEGCKVLEKRLVRDINQIVDGYKMHHKAYDDETNHGGKQGAVIR